MPQYFGKPPSIDLISQASEIKAAFDESKLGKTPSDVQSLAWGFLQSNFEPAIEDLVIASLPKFDSSSGHPGIVVSQQPADNPGSSPGMTCDDVCNCDCGGGPSEPDSKGACCLPSGSTYGTCIQATPQECATYGGVFLGPGVSCTDANCTGEANTTTDSSQCNSPGCETRSVTTQTDTSESESTSLEFTPDSEAPDPDSSGGEIAASGGDYPPILDPNHKQPGKGPGGDIWVVFGSGGFECADALEGGEIVIEPGNLPSKYHFNPGDLCCGTRCVEICFEDECYTTPPDCVRYPVETYLECPCGDHRTWQGYDPDNTPWENENTPGGTRWKFNVPAHCCCPEGQIPDTDDPPSAFTPPSYTSSQGQIPTLGSGGEACIRVTWGMICSPGVPGPIPPDSPCQDLCPDCEDFFGQELYTQETYCLDCCDHFEP